MKLSLTKFLSFFSKIKTAGLNISEKVKAFEPKKLKTLLLVFAAIGALNLAYSLFSVYTLISFTIMASGLSIYFKINLIEIRKKGLLAYLPGKYQKVFLHRSLFDIICDLWFIPRISVYVKALFSPFLIKIDPSEAIHQFKELPPGARRVFLTKGIVNIFPGFVKGALLPQNELVTDEESSDTSSAAEEELSNNENSGGRNIEDRERPVADILFKDSSSSNKTGSGPVETQNKHRIDQNGLLIRVRQTSTDEEALVNHNFSLSKQLEVRKTLPSFADVNPMRAHLDYGERKKSVQHVRNQTQRGLKRSGRNYEKSGPRLERMFYHEAEHELRAQVLDSSKMVEKRIKNKPQLADTWDNLELFAKKHRERMKKQRVEKTVNTNRMELKGPLQMLQNIATLLSKDALMSKLDGGTLIKLFAVSSLALVMQFKMFKKTRYWVYHTLHILTYIIGFALSTGSMALLMFKLKRKYREWKEQQEQLEQQNMEAGNQLTDREDE